MNLATCMVRPLWLSQHQQPKTNETKIWGPHLPKDPSPTKKFGPPSLPTDVQRPTNWLKLKSSASLGKVHPYYPPGNEHSYWKVPIYGWFINSPRQSSMALLVYQRVTSILSALDPHKSLWIPLNLPDIPMNPYSSRFPWRPSNPIQLPCLRARSTILPGHGVAHGGVHAHHVSGQDHLSRIQKGFCGFRTWAIGI